MKTIKVTDKLHKFLEDHGTKSDSFEEIIWRMIGLKEITKEDSKKVPSDYEDKLKSGVKKK